MDILFLTTTFPSLSETFILNQTIGLLDRDHSLTVLARTSESAESIHEEINEYNLRERTEYFHMPDNNLYRFGKALGKIASLLGHHPFKTIRGLRPRIQRQYAKTLEAPYVLNAFHSLGKDFDIVHAHFGWNGILGAVLKASGFHKGPLITSFYGSDARTHPDTWGEHVYESVFEYSEVLTGSSRALSRDVKSLSSQTTPVRTVYTGIPTTKFTPKSVGSSESTANLLSVGRLVPCKGYGYAIRAVRKVVEEGIDVRYELVGDGPIRSNLSSLTRDLGIEDSVHLTGSLPRESVIQKLQNTDIFLAPSVTGSGGVQDSIGTSLLEAMSCGLPVIATDLPSIQEVITTGENGFLCSQKNPECLTDHIMQLHQDSDLRQSVGSSARKTITQNHSIKSLTDQLEDLYTKIL